MEWRLYIQQVIGSDRQIDVARKTGVDQTTISRWLSAEQDAPRLSSQAVAAFARGYGRPVLEAFVVAGFLTPEEAGMPVDPVVDLTKVEVGDLVAELNRRLNPSNPRRRSAGRRVS